MAFRVLRNAYAEPCTFGPSVQTQPTALAIYDNLQTLKRAVRETLTVLLSGTLIFTSITLIVPLGGTLIVPLKGTLARSLNDKPPSLKP